LRILGFPGIRLGKFKGEFGPKVLIGGKPLKGGFSRGGRSTGHNTTEVGSSRPQKGGYKG